MTIDLEQKEFNKIMDGMEQVNRKMAEQISASAPMCHFRKMFLDEGDLFDGYSEMWWECAVCGHIKPRKYYY